MMWHVSLHLTTLTLGQVMRRRISRRQEINELVRVLKVVALASFQGLFRHLRGETATVLRKDSPFADTRLEPGTSR